MFARLLAIALVLLPAAADAAVLTANAGLDGVGRPGRWLPVRVAIEARSEDISGDLIAEWGPARVRRAVIVPAPSRREFELYLRTGDVRDVVTVRLEQHGHETSRVAVPLRIVGADDHAVLSVRHGPWPASWRSYDAADELVLDGDGPSSPEAKDAIALWRALRRAGDIDRSLPSSDAVPAPSAPARLVSPVLLFYTLAVAALMLLFARARGRASVSYSATIIVVAAGSTAAWASGRSSAVVVRHQSIAEQFDDGGSRTLITIRATAQYPTQGRFLLRASTEDGAIDGANAIDDEGRFDSEGFPTLVSEGGIGATSSFTVEGTSTFRAFEVTHDGSRTRIANVSAVTLERCEFPPGFQAPPDTRLRPGQAVEGEPRAADVDPIVTCRLAGSPIEFSEAHHAVTTEGATAVVYHLRPVQQ